MTAKISPVQAYAFIARESGSNAWIPDLTGANEHYDVEAKLAREVFRRDQNVASRGVVPSAADAQAAAIRRAELEQFEGERVLSRPERAEADRLDRSLLKYVSSTHDLESRWRAAASNAERDADKRLTAMFAKWGETWTTPAGRDDMKRVRDHGFWVMGEMTRREAKAVIFEYEADLAKFPPKHESVHVMSKHMRDATIPSSAAPIIPWNEVAEPERAAFVSDDKRGFVPPWHPYVAELQANMDNGARLLDDARRLSRWRESTLEIEAYRKQVVTDRSKARDGSGPTLGDRFRSIMKDGVTLEERERKERSVIDGQVEAATATIGEASAEVAWRAEFQEARAEASARDGDLDSINHAAPAAELLVGSSERGGATVDRHSEAYYEIDDYYVGRTDEMMADWDSWLKMDRSERAAIAASYADSPGEKGRRWEDQVAHFNEREDGKREFLAMDQVDRDRITKEFFALDPVEQNRSRFHDGVYLGIAMSDIPKSEMPFGARLAGEEAGLPGFERDYEAEQKQYSEYVDQLLAGHEADVALEEGRALRFDEKSLGYQVAQCALQKEIATRGLGSGHDLEQEHLGAKWSYESSQLVDGELRHSFSHANHPRGGKVEFTVQGAPLAELGELEQLNNVPDLAWRNLDENVADALIGRHLDQSERFPHPFEPQIRGALAAEAAISARHDLVDEIRAGKDSSQAADRAREQEGALSLGR
jgi:hypothetical protein